MFRLLARKRPKFPSSDAANSTSGRLTRDGGHDDTEVLASAMSVLSVGGTSLFDTRFDEDSIYVPPTTRTSRHHRSSMESRASLTSSFERAMSPFFDNDTVTLDARADFYEPSTGTVTITVRLGLICRPDEDENVLPNPEGGALPPIKFESRWSIKRTLEEVRYLCHTLRHDCGARRFPSPDPTIFIGLAPLATASGAPLGSEVFFSSKAQVAAKRVAQILRQSVQRAASLQPTATTQPTTTTLRRGRKKTKEVVDHAANVAEPPVHSGMVHEKSASAPNLALVPRPSHYTTSLSSSSSKSLMGQVLHTSTRYLFGGSELPMLETKKKSHVNVERELDRWLQEVVKFLDRKWFSAMDGQLHALVEAFLCNLPNYATGRESEEAPGGSEAAAAPSSAREPSESAAASTRGPSRQTIVPSETSVYDLNPALLPGVDVPPSFLAALRHVCPDAASRFRVNPRVSPESREWMLTIKKARRLMKHALSDAGEWIDLKDVLAYAQFLALAAYRQHTPPDRMWSSFAGLPKALPCAPPSPKQLTEREKDGTWSPDVEWMACVDVDETRYRVVTSREPAWFEAHACEFVDERSVPGTPRARKQFLHHWHNLSSVVLKRVEQRLKRLQCEESGVLF